MHLTPRILEAVYECWRALPPFRGWKLPPGEEVEFHVTRQRDRCADHSFERGRHIIRVSAAKHAHLSSIMESVAHEICHMRQLIVAPKERSEHGRAFKSAAASVCRAHPHLDPKAF